MLNSEVIHIHLARDYFTTSALLLSAAMRRPIIAQPHGMLMGARSMSVRAYDHLFLRIYLKYVSHWLVLTDEEEEHLLKLGVPRLKISRTFNSVSSSTAKWKYPHRPSFSFISRLAKRKQPTTFLQAAFSALDTVDAEFYIAGNDQGELHAIRLAIEESKHRAHIHYLGDLSQENVSDLLARSTALVLPSRGEVFPMIAVEAISIGTPVILTTESGISAQLQAAEGAIVVPPRAEDIAAAICLLATSRQAAERVSARATEVFERHWSPAALKDQLYSLYSNLAEGTQKRSCELS